MSNLMTTKTCNLCKQEKDLSLFSVDNRSKSGYQTRCKDCQAAVKKEMAAYYRGKHLEYKYGMTHEQYESMLEEQDHKCAVCGIEEKYAENSRLCIDHNHDTGQVRGLLCKKCNQAIGLLQDNADFCDSAGKYLRLHG
jgi:hypothetical protein